MGDRTYAEVRINKYYYERHKEKIDEMGYDEAEEIEDEVTIKDYEANYGSLEALESFCQENNIEYDRRWEAGGDYGPGEEYARIVDGELVVHELSDEGAAILNEHKETLEIITTGGTLEDVKKHLEKKINLLEPFEVTPLKAPQSIDFIKNA